MRIAKAVAGTIGSALVGLVITFAAIPEWTLMNLEQHFWQTIGGFLISAAFGGAVVFIVHATYMGWKLGSKPCKAFDALRDIDELGECESLADMVEPVKQLAAKDAEIDRLNESHAAALAAKDAEMDRVRQDCERRVFEATMPLDRTIKLTKEQAELVVEMIEKDRSGDNALIMAKRGGDMVIDSLTEKGVFSKAPFGSIANTFNYAMNPEWLALFRNHEAEVRDIASR